jgi:glycosyltransferase involved in cell wall biosynthesis
MCAALRILHLHSTFNLGGKEARAVRLMNLFGDRARHVILSSEPDALQARDIIDPGIIADFPADAPPLYGKPSMGRYWRIARFMQRFDLVLSYNWGAMDGVMAHRLLSPMMRLPPLIHHEDGFNNDAGEPHHWKRNRFRQLALGGDRRLVVPSHTLHRIARATWHVPAHRLHHIPNGIAVHAYGAPMAGAIPGLQRRDGELLIGTVAGLRRVKNLPRLVRAFAPLAPLARLVIVGAGPERAVIMAEATRLGVADRVLLPGFLPKPADFIGLFDIFALSSDSEQCPISLVEAMAAGLPALSTDVGDVAQMVAAPNRAFVTPLGDDAAFGKALAQLVAQPDLRRALGQANQVRAKADYGEAAMVARYAALYGVPS